MSFYKKELNNEIIKQLEEAMGYDICNGMIPVVYTQKVSARKYHVGWRFSKIGTKVGSIHTDPHAAFDKNMNIVWVRNREL